MQSPKDIITKRVGRHPDVTYDSYETQNKQELHFIEVDENVEEEFLQSIKENVLENPSVDSVEIRSKESLLYFKVYK